MGIDTVVCGAGMSALLLLSGCAMAPASRTAPLGLERAIWVTRWDWRSEADIRRVFAHCADLGFKAVLFQVRGNGTALFRSRREIWSDTFKHEDPGFDPLAVAVESALQQGLQLHAWINLLPGWSGSKAPDDSRQLYHSHQDWFLRDASGQREALGDKAYLGLNPCLPEVRGYLADLCTEIAAVDGVHGVHLDYVRMTSGDHPGGIERFPDDERTRALFRVDKGLEAQLHPVAYRQWKIDCVTKLVAEIRSKLRRSGAPVLLSAAVMADPGRAMASGQDWQEWAKRGLVDALLPMAYADDDAWFRRMIKTASARAGRCAVIAGIGVYKHEDPLQTVRQMDAAREQGAQGVALFSYGELSKPMRAAFLRDLQVWLQRDPSAAAPSR